jgi:hypothetical protein
MHGLPLAQAAAPAAGSWLWTSSGSLLMLAGVLFVAWLIALAVKDVIVARLNAGLKSQMLERGMTAEEIERVLRANEGESGEKVSLPCACEAVVADDDGDWRAGLVLQVAEGRYLVHYVGEEMDENEWVGEDRVRFPAGSELPTMFKQLRADRNGVPRKAPMESEL